MDPVCYSVADSVVGHNRRPSMRMFSLQLILEHIWKGRVQK